MNVFDEFQQRGILYQASEGLAEVLAEQKTTAYVGFDPSAPSLHVGSLLPVMALVHLQRHGHTPIAIVGGGTGLIGDPSGKELERPLLPKERIQENLEGIKRQLSRFLEFGSGLNAAKIINNADWLGGISLMDFLRDVGKYFTVNYMLAKESVQRRAASDEGISFTEFSYMLLQAFDFLTLFDRYGCTLQMGGSDQWGNIVAGVELIRRVRAARAHALVLPLITNSRGTKFGKTESGTVWLDSGLTSPYRFYQFWLNTDDGDVVRYLRYFTLLPLSEIEGLGNLLVEAPAKRQAQRVLASEVTRLIHGDDAFERAQHATAVLFGGDISDLTAREVTDIFEDVPSTTVPKASFEGPGMPLRDLVVKAGCATSKSEAKRIIEGGGIYVNNRRATNIDATVELSSFVDGKILVIRRGDKHYCLIKAEEGV